MDKFKVTMVKKEIYKAETTIEHDNSDGGEIADRAWAGFETLANSIPDYDYSTKVERVEE